MGDREGRRLEVQRKRDAKGGRERVKKDEEEIEEKG